MTSPLQELGGGLRWSQEQGILLLWVYLDESGIHDPAVGQLRRLALGGCLASYADWLRFEGEWSPALKAEGIDCFHMTDFEAYQEAFFGWSKPRHESFLNKLLACFDSHVKSIFGAGCEIADPSEPLKMSYLRNVKGAIGSAFREGNWWAFPDEKISVVFAKHPQVSAVHIEQYIEAIEQTIPRLDSIAFGAPEEIVPLQAADLVAYEIARYIPHHDISRMRYPMLRLWGTSRMSIGREGSRD